MHAANWRSWLEPFTDQPAVRALEIGSFEGRSAIWLLENILTHPTARLTCIDCDFSPPFRKNIRSVRHKIQMMQGHSGWLLRKSVFRPGCFKFIYIDGGHRSNEVLEDAVLAFRLLATGGIMIFDDYEWISPTPEIPQSMPRIAIDGFLAAFEKEIEVLHQGWQVAIQKRRADDWPADLRERIEWFVEELLGRRPLKAVRERS
jgi:cephalosporin hydroxylase